MIFCKKNRKAREFTQEKIISNRTYLKEDIVFLRPIVMILSFFFQTKTSPEKERFAIIIVRYKYLQL